MPIAPTNTRSYTYKVTAPPAVLAVSLADVKLWLNITGTASDSLLTLMIESATEYAEEATGRWFITRTAETYRELFPSYFNHEGYYRDLPAIEIRRSPLQTVDSITYLDDSVETTVTSADYYNTLESDFSHIVATERGSGFPSLDEARMQNITVTFKAGYGDASSDVPAWARTAIASHVMAMWANRGDCVCGDGGGEFLPAQARSTYRQHKIINF
jgi:uncharacterized phiE125 gp8 family phage protein